MSNNIQDLLTELNIELNTQEKQIAGEILVSPEFASLVEAVRLY